MTRRKTDAQKAGRGGPGWAGGVMRGRGLGVWCLRALTFERLAGEGASLSSSRDRFCADMGDENGTAIASVGTRAGNDWTSNKWGAATSEKSRAERGVGAALFLVQ